MHGHTLGELVRQRRQSLGLSIRAAAKAAGVDRATWTALEEGTRATQDRHYAGIEHALRWPAGSVEAKASGRPETTPSTPDLRDDNERVIWSMDALPEDLRREYLELYRARQQENTPGKESA